MNREALIELSHSRLLNAQRLHRYIISPQCQKAIDLATDEQIKTMCECNDIVRLRKLTRDILTNEIEAKNITELRRLGSAYRIKGYCHMTKASLLSEIIHRISDADNIVRERENISIRDGEACPSIRCEGNTIQSITG